MILVPSLHDIVLEVAFLGLCCPLLVHGVALQRCKVKWLDDLVRRRPSYRVLA